MINMILLKVNTIEMILLKVDMINNMILSKVSNDSQRSLSTDFWVFILATGLLRLVSILIC